MDSVNSMFIFLTNGELGRVEFSLDSRGGYIVCWNEVSKGKGGVEWVKWSEIRNEDRVCMLHFEDWRNTHSEDVFIDLERD